MVKASNVYVCHQYAVLEMTTSTSILMSDLDWKSEIDCVKLFINIGSDTFVSYYHLLIETNLLVFRTVVYRKNKQTYNNLSIKLSH